MQQPHLSSLGKGNHPPNNFQLLNYSFQFTCQGVVKGAWTWIVVRKKCCNSQIFNCKLWFVNWFPSQGVDEKSLYKDLFSGIITSIQWNHCKHSMESVHACIARNGRLWQIHQNLLIKLSEPFVRKNLFVWYSYLQCIPTLIAGAAANGYTYFARLLHLRKKYSLVLRQFRGKLLPIILLKIRIPCHSERSEESALGQRIIQQETLRDSSLTLRMT